jgi:hypothetical protein
VEIINVVESISGFCPYISEKPAWYIVVGRAPYTCRSCGMKFDSFGDTQRHILVEHMQKGDIP